MYVSFSQQEAAGKSSLPGSQATPQLEDKPSMSAKRNPFKLETNDDNEEHEGEKGSDTDQKDGESELDYD